MVEEQQGNQTSKRVS